ncbi:hypothetical protein [Caballeronia sp. GAFFF3]|uniref:hypothetical protein n=1 Tax=Caballeronia sp. GAFFF3 TaxID=2921759 RepID=UPI0020297CD2|nr:hypothetical protein [Caballeronia sp. GAFFF3]
MTTMSDSVTYDTRLRLMDEASRYRDQASRQAGAKQLVLWDCGRGHRWDKTLDIAQARGGALLSHRYVDAATPLSWRCAYGHVWDATPDAVSRHWCSECARTVFAAVR